LTPAGVAPASVDHVRARESPRAVVGGDYFVADAGAPPWVPTSRRWSNSVVSVWP